MGKLFAWLHPKNDGLEIEAEEGTEVSLSFDPNVPPSEIWLKDKDQNVIKKVKLKPAESNKQRGR